MPLELPGRGRYFPEPLLTDFPSLLAWLLDKYEDELQGDYAIFGHSMGALLGYELALHAQVPPQHLVLSASRAPNLLAGTKDGRHTNSDHELIKALEQLDGLPRGIFSERDLIDVVLPPVRADLEALHGYQWGGPRDLGVPLTIVGGDSDPQVAPKELHSWLGLSSAAGDVHVFRGGHFYLQHDPDGLLTLLRSLLLEPAKGATW